MDDNSLKSKISELLNSIGYDLYSLSFKRISGEYRLEIIVDRVEPIDLNAISEVTEKISSYLDESDPIKEKYVLDVSSLGAEKPIAKDKLPSYIGKYVNIHMINPVDGENIIEGELSYADTKKIEVSVRIKTRIKKYETTLENVSKARLAIKI